MQRSTVLGASGTDILKKAAMSNIRKYMRALTEISSKTALTTAVSENNGQLIPARATAALTELITGDSAVSDYAACIFWAVSATKAIYLAVTETDHRIFAGDYNSSTDTISVLEITTFPTNGEDFLTD